AGSKAIGMTLYEAEKELNGADAQIISLVRNDVRLTMPRAAGAWREGDVVLIEAEPAALASALDALGLVFGEGKTDDNETEDTTEDQAGTEETDIDDTANDPPHTEDDADHDEAE